MTASAPVLRAAGLHVHRGNRRILEDVDLDVSPGEVVAVLGPNGAGKSTLLETLANVLQPSAGTIQRNGQVAAALQSPDMARRSARANVELALAWSGVPRRHRRTRAVEALTAMRADHLADRPAAMLSGGERRRVHLARAVAIQPDLLLLDEPFAGLDNATRAALLDDAAVALRGSARAVVVVVHDRAEAWALADRLVVLLAGRVAATGPPRDVLDRPPTPEVARFLGFTGDLQVGPDRLLTRPVHVQVDPAGELVATVMRLIPVEDGARAELEVEGGRLSALVPLPGPQVGESLTVRISGGVRYRDGQLVTPTDHA
ncbi:MAG TPA: ABC transporter ATP-binding protein [Mycobacteriales bacterium]|nr:ABC transporter ATP-binding protein [Mycobacteriales bacterium]